MMGNALVEKSFGFAVRVVNLYKYLTESESNNIIEDLVEIIKLLVSIIKTTKGSQNAKK